MIVNSGFVLNHPQLNEPLKKHDGSELTLGFVCADSLLKSAVSADIAVEYYSLALKFINGGEVELSCEQATRIKEAVSKQYIVVITAQVAKILDGK